MLRSIKSSQRLPRAILVIVDTTAPTISEGNSDVSVVKNGVGDISITYLKPFQRVGVIGASGVTGDYVSIASGTATASGCRLLMKTDAGVASDGIMHIQIIGFDAADKI